MTLNIPHSLPKAEALSRIKQLLSNLKEEHKDKISDVQENWQDDKGSFSFKAQGFNLSGDMQVTDKEVEIHSELPFALSFFKGMISSMITSKATELLA